jgi:uncharacterized protein (DUF58 family)
MRLALPKAFQGVLDNWLFQLHGAESGEVLLHQRRVFILPTKAGMAYALMLVGLFVGSVNYGLNMGFALTFLVAACSLVGLLLTFRNLAFLRLNVGRCPPVFAGSQAVYSFQLNNHGRHARYAIEAGFLQEGQPWAPTAIDLPAFGQGTLQLSCATSERGWQSAPRIRLQTRFPLGLFRAWSFWTPDVAVLVYPRPESHPPPLPAATAGDAVQGASAGQEEFAGVRAWQAGDSSSRLAWRQIARLDASGEGLISKAFEGQAGNELCLDEKRLLHLPLEARLSRLTAWVLQAQAQGLHWRLALDSTQSGTGYGEQHLHECLHLLALYPVPGRGEPRRARA